MTRRRKLLVALGLLQLSLWFGSWTPYFAHYIKAGEQRIWGTVEEAVAGLEREHWLVERETSEFTTSVDGLIYVPVRQEVHRKREIAWLPIVSLGGLGLVFIALGLLPDRWLERPAMHIEDAPAEH